MRSLEESRPQRQKVDGGSWGVVEGVHASWGQRLSLGRWEVLEMGGGSLHNGVSVLRATELCT